MIDIFVDLLQEVAASIAFRLSQAFHLPTSPRVAVLAQFVVFTLIVVPLVVVFVAGGLWLVFRLAILALS